jgi:hypothetical protein
LHIDKVRKGQIAHLNKDRNDHRFTNLAYLCFDHHDEFDSISSQSKGLSLGEVRFYRDRLYQRLDLDAADAASAHDGRERTPTNGVDGEQRDELRRVASAHLTEWQRLREDFEAEARRYPSLKLIVFFIEVDKPQTADVKFTKPNHIINLWQFSRDIVPLMPMELTKFGMVGAERTAFAAVVGKKTHQFVRMATRAGAMVPNNLANEIAANVRRMWADGSGKPVFVANDNPLAKWLNLVLVATVNCHPERLKNGALPVDPFAASLPVFDLILGSHIVGGR